MQTSITRQPPRLPRLRLALHTAFSLAVFACLLGGCGGDPRPDPRPPDESGPQAERGATVYQPGASASTPAAAPSVRLEVAGGRPRPGDRGTRSWL